MDGPVQANVAGNIQQCVHFHTNCKFEIAHLNWQMFTIWGQHRPALSLFRLILGTVLPAGSLQRPEFKLFLSNTPIWTQEIHCCYHQADILFGGCLKQVPAEFRRSSLHTAACVGDSRGFYAFF